MSEERSTLEHETIPADEKSSVASVEVYEKPDDISQEDWDKLPQVGQEQVGIVRTVERQAKIARILERGFTVDRLKVELPPHLHGEWVPDRPEEILRKKDLGFWPDTEFATNRSLHSDGTEVARVGDCVHYITTQANKDLLDDVLLEQYYKRHGDPRKRSREGERATAEDAEYATSVEATGMPVIDEGRVSPADSDDVAAVLRAANTK